MTNSPGHTPEAYLHDPNFVPVVGETPENTVERTVDGVVQRIDPELDAALENHLTQLAMVSERLMLIDRNEANRTPDGTPSHNAAIAGRFATRRRDVMGLANESREAIEELAFNGDTTAVIEFLTDSAQVSMTNARFAQTELGEAEGELHQADDRIAETQSRKVRGQRLDRS